MKNYEYEYKSSSNKIYQRSINSIDQTWFNSKYSRAQSEQKSSTMTDIRRSILLLSSILFVRSYQIGSNQFVPERPQYTENLVPDEVTQNYPVIPLTLGYIRGSWLTSAGGRRYAAYKGIPYAEPPLGNLRFEPPQERKPWRGVRDALNHGAQCPQQLFLLDTYVGQEDCLYLNLYIPQVQIGNEARIFHEKLLPIIFFVHGGAWTVGAGDMDNYLYGPDIIMDEDVILVTINYRLGALGFLYLENQVRGNMGLKDQLMALKLIKSNALSFGGDPDRIVIMGESAGAASAEVHTLNPETRKLISGVIAQSGSILAPWAWTRPDVLDTRTRRLAKFLRCPNDSESRGIIECLKTASPVEIVRYQFSTDWSPLQIPIGISFSPTMEPSGYSDAVLTDCPLDLLVRLRETTQTLPYLTGYNTLEGQFFTKVAVSLIDSIVHFGLRKPFALRREPKTVSYLKQKPYITQPSSPIIDNILGDLEFKAPIVRAARYHASAGSNVYLYHFAFTGRNDFVKLFWDNRAPTHMDELTYMFQGRGMFGGLPRLEEASPEAAVSQRLIRMWTNFAKTGNPTPVNNTGVDIYWPRGPSKLLTIGKELTIGNSPVQTGWSSFLNRQCFL